LWLIWSGKTGLICNKCNSDERGLKGGGSRQVQNRGFAAVHKEALQPSGFGQIVQSGLLTFRNYICGFTMTFGRDVLQASFRLSLPVLASL